MTARAATSVDTQVDRTVLSWARTCATLAVVALLFARWAAEVGPIAFLPTATGLCAAIVIWLVTRSQAGRRRAQFSSGRTDPPVGAAAALCAICLLLASTGLLVLLLG